MSKRIKFIIKKILGPYYLYIVKKAFQKIFKTTGYYKELDLDERLFIFYSGFIKKGDLCFDIGANFGNRTNIFLKLGAKVVAVEPQVYCCRYLRMKFGAQIYIEQKAIGEVEDNRKLYISNWTGMSSLSSEWIEAVKKGRYSENIWYKTEIVDVITLDSLISKYGMPAFIKIDVEGFEYEVLKGLNKDFNIISFEYTLPEFKEKAINCLEHLRKLNSSIEFNYSVDERLKYELNDWIGFEEIIRMINNDNFPNEAGDVYVRKIHLHNRYRA